MMTSGCAFFVWGEAKVILPIVAHGCPWLSKNSPKITLKKWIVRMKLKKMIGSYEDSYVKGKTNFDKKYINIGRKKWKKGCEIKIMRRNT